VGQDRWFPYRSAWMTVHAAFSCLSDLEQSTLCLISYVKDAIPPGTPTSLKRNACVGGVHILVGLAKQTEVVFGNPAPRFFSITGARVLTQTVVPLEGCLDERV
jgi:hypothetical protein